VTIRFAFAGFRHGHINAVVAAAEEHEGAAVVAACEEDADTRQALATAGHVTVTHDCFERMLEEVACDAVAVGDYYAKRGGIIIKALQAGKHVLTDKPVCTSLAEQDTIERLARERRLCVGCQLDLRGSGTYIALKKVIADGSIGDVQTVCITGQHALSLDTRPQWYFDPGCHGGTINDIGIHAVDLVEWLTGHRIAAVTAARTWNAKASAFPHFNDCAQFMLELDNGGSVLGDVSYLAPDRYGYGAGNCWRVTCHGTRGVAETNIKSDVVKTASDSDEDIRRVANAESIPHRYFSDFMADVAGRAQDADLTTERVLRTSRLALSVQRVADDGPAAFGMDVG